MFIIPAFRRQEDHRFGDNLGYIVRHYFKQESYGSMSHNTYCASMRTREWSQWPCMWLSLQRETLSQRRQWKETAGRLTSVSGTCPYIHKIHTHTAGQMTQWVRVLTTSLADSVPIGGSQWSLTSGAPTHSFSLCTHQACMWITYIYADTHKIKIWGGEGAH